MRIVAPPAYPVATLGSFAASPPLAVPVAYPLLGVALHAQAAGDTSPEAYLADLRANVSAQTRATGAVIAHAIPAIARPNVDAWPTLLPAQYATMRALKNNFDPHGLCNPGRFIGGL